MPDIDISRTLGPAYQTLPLYLGQALDQTGQVFFFNSSSALATSIKGGNATAAIDYTLPVAAPTANGQVLSGTTTGTLSWAAPGKILQVVMGTSGTSFATTSSTYQTSNLTGSITPSATTSNVIVLAWGTIRNANATATNAFYTLFRNSTDLGDAGGAGFGRSAISGIGPCSMGYLDSPATTSAITYSVKIKSDDNTTTVNFGSSGTQVLLMAEVAA